MYVAIAAVGEDKRDKRQQIFRVCEQFLGSKYADCGSNFSALNVCANIETIYETAGSNLNRYQRTPRVRERGCTLDRCQALRITRQLKSVTERNRLAA
jgi:hypothetical protein